MHPYSSPTANPNQLIMAPATHNVKLRPMLPTEVTMAPGVAKMPLPITREMMMMYALLHPIFLPSTAVSGRTSSSIERWDTSPGWMVDADRDESIDLRGSGLLSWGSKDSEPRRGVVSISLEVIVDPASKNAAPSGLVLSVSACRFELRGNCFSTPCPCQHHNMTFWDFGNNGTWRIADLSGLPCG